MGIGEGEGQAVGVMNDYSVLRVGSKSAVLVVVGSTYSLCKIMGNQNAKGKVNKLTCCSSRIGGGTGQ
jgi:hypothetical protein